MLHYSYHGWDELKSPVSNTTFWSSVRISKSNIKSYSESYRFTEHFVISFDIYQSTRAPVVGFTLRLLSIFTVVCEPRRYFANYPRQISVCCSSRLDFPRLNELLLLSWPPLVLASVRTWSGPEVKLLRSRQLLTNILQVLSTLASPKKSELKRS